MRNLSPIYNFEVLYKVSFGGPRDDRYYKIVFPHTTDFQFHVYKSYQKLIIEDSTIIKSCTYVDVASGEELAYVNKRGIMFFTVVGPLYINPDSFYFDVFGVNSINNFK